MSYSNSASNEQTPSPSMWYYAKPYVVPPCAASVSLLPTFWAFVDKTARQLGCTPPKNSVAQHLKGGVRAMPTIGTQVLAVTLLEGRFGNEKGFLSTLFSSTVVAGLSVPLFAIFSAQASGLHWKDALKRLNGRQSVALMAREVSFLASVSFSGPGSQAIKAYLGDSKAVEYASAMFIGFVGSLAGHPADTGFTRMQNGRPVLNLGHATKDKTWRNLASRAYQGTTSLYSGGLTRAVGVSLFSACYKAVNEAFS